MPDLSEAFGVVEKNQPPIPKLMEKRATGPGDDPRVRVQPLLKHSRSFRNDETLEPKREGKEKKEELERDPGFGI